MTDELIDRLTAELKPIHPLAMYRLLAGAILVSMVIAAALMLTWLGLRGDIASAPATAIFWIKFGYTLLLSMLGGITVLILARPEGGVRWPWVAGLGLIAILLAGAFWQVTRAEPQDVMPLVVGGTNLVCPLFIIALSLPVLAGSMLALRKLAPGRPTLTGLAAGLMSGGAGAWIYSFHCGENGMMFLALWYTLGIAIVGILGAVLGRLLIRW